MKKTLLKFPSHIYLIAFRRYAKATSWEIDLTNLTVYCDCSKKELIAACNDFKAEVIDIKECPTASTNSVGISTHSSAYSHISDKTVYSTA